MNVKVIRAFHDKVGAPPHKIGAVLEVSEARGQELISAGYCEAIPAPQAEERPKPKTSRKKK